MEGFQTVTLKAKEALGLINQDVLQCEWAQAPYLLFSENVFSPIIYYSHLFPAIAGLFTVYLIWTQGQITRKSAVLASIALIFTVWSLFDLILWATEVPSLVMFFWSSLIYLDPLIYFASLYLVYLFLTNKNPPWQAFAASFAMYLPIIFLAPTSLNLTAFDYTNCEREAFEGPLWYYTYFIEIVAVAWIIALLTRHVPKIKDIVQRKQAALLGVGILLFLITFSWGNIVGSLTFDWSVAQYGLFGLPILLGFLVYIVVRFHAFNTKLIGAEALVLSLWILLFSLLFLQTINSARPIILVTLILFGFLGYNLVRSVRMEVEQREQIESLVENLKSANDRLRNLDQLKTEFVSIASHQMRSPLTAITGYSSLIMEGSFGPISGKVREAVGKIFRSGKQMSVAVDDFLNVTRIEQGRMKYNFQTFDLTPFVVTMIEDMKLAAQEKHLDLQCKVEQKSLIVNADQGKLKQVLTNLIDNAIKYTQKGMITVTLRKEDDKAIVSVADSGIGIPESDLADLFTKFSRASNANSANVQGTGLGLYIAMQLISAHKGRIWVDTKEGKGSTFSFELPLAKE